MTALIVRDAFTYLTANELHYYPDQGVTKNGRA